MLLRSNALFNVVIPVTVNVPPIAVLPVASATVNLLLSQAIPPLAFNKLVNVVTPVTANEPPREVAPVPTVNVLPSATLTLSFNSVVALTVNVSANVVVPPTVAF